MNRKLFDAQISVRDVSKIKGITTQAVYKAIKFGRLNTTKVYGKMYIINDKKLKDYINDMGV